MLPVMVWATIVFDGFTSISQLSKEHVTSMYNPMLHIKLDICYARQLLEASSVVPLPGGDSDLEAWQLLEEFSSVRLPDDDTSPALSYSAAQSSQRFTFVA